MRTYPKTDSVFKRGLLGKKQLLEGEYYSEYVEYIKDLPWVFTEKIDGTNVRIFWDGHKVSFGGRTEVTDMPVALLEKLQLKFGGEANEEIFEQMFGEKEVMLFGEGYGGKIQGRDNGYSPTEEVILFDGLVGNTWLRRETLKEIAEAFYVDVVPIRFWGTVEEAVEFVKQPQMSFLGDKTKPIEGLVGTPLVRLLDVHGKRIIIKIKARDFDTITQ